MGNNPSPNFSIIRQQLNIIEPQVEHAFPITIAQWDQIMNRIKECDEPSPFYDSLGWSCLSLGVGAFLSALAFFASVDFVKPTPTGGESVHKIAVGTELVFVATGLAGVGVGYISLRYAKDQRRQNKTMRQWIVDDMRLFQDKHPAAALPTTVPPQQPAIMPPMSSVTMTTTP
jgi:hypothetical protein